MLATLENCHNGARCRLGHQSMLNFIERQCLTVALDQLKPTVVSGGIELDGDGVMCSHKIFQAWSDPLSREISK